MFHGYTRLSLPFLLFAGLTGLSAQETPVRVGVAVMQNEAQGSVSGKLERDRLVQSLNRMKPDKKTHVQVQGVPLDAMTMNEADEEAASKKCTYVVLTTLTELRGFDDPYQHTPNTIETNPNSQWSMQNNARGERMDPEYRVTVEYKLFRTGGSQVAGSPYSTQAATNEIDAVSQVMERIASRVADEVRKSAPAAANE